MSLYFDNASTTQIDERVLDSMLPFLKEVYCNPSSLYQGGRAAKQAIVLAQSKIAQFFT